MHDPHDDLEKISAPRSEHFPGNAIIINEVQLLLAEKRTSLAVMRTGIAVIALPLSVMSLLIATSKYYDVTQVLHLLIPIVICCTALLVLGVYLITRSTRRMRHSDFLVQRLKERNSFLAEFLD